MSAPDIPSEYTIHVTPLQITGNTSSPLTVDAGLDDINVALVGDANKPVAFDLGLDDVNVDLGLIGNPDQPVTIDLGLDDVNVELGLIGNPDQPVTIDLGLDDVNVDLGLDNVNVCLSLALTEIPRVRLHLPTKYDFGVCLFGLKIVNFSFAGESMLVTEDNPPRVFHSPRARPAQARHAAAQQPQSFFRVTLDEEEAAREGPSESG
jgi:hypothetical protein